MGVQIPLSGPLFRLNNYMKTFKNFHDSNKKREVIKDVIEELEKIKLHHNFSNPVSKDFLQWLSEQLLQVGIEPEDILASIGESPDKQEYYLIYRSAPGCGMGKGALGDLKTLLSQEQ